MKKRSASKIYLTYQLIFSLLFFTFSTVCLIYQVEVAKLNPLQLILIGTALEGACFLFEIPTGIVADLYSRKKSAIIGFILIGIGFLIEGSIPSFKYILLAQLFVGIGYTFVSGAIDAWVVDEENMKEEEIDRFYLRASKFAQIGSASGIILGVILGNISLKLPLILSGILFELFAIYMYWIMPETNFKPSFDGSNSVFRNMYKTFENSMSQVKKSKVILFLLVINIIYGVASEGLDRLYTIHFLNDTVMPDITGIKPVTWFGFLGILGMFISAIFIDKIIENLDKNDGANKKNIVISLNLVYILMTFVFGLTGKFSLMFVSYIFIMISKLIIFPLYNSELNKNITDSSARATVISTSGQANALGQILGGPFVGYLATKTSVGIGITSTGILLIPVLIMYKIMYSKVISTKNEKEQRERLLSS